MFHHPINFSRRLGWAAAAIAALTLPLPSPAQDGGAKRLTAPTSQAPASPGRRPAQGIAAATPSLPAQTEQLDMNVGEIRMLPVRGKVTRIALGNGAFASATTVDTSIMLIGEAPGQTSMMVWTDQQVSAYRLRVSPADSAESRLLLDRLVAESNNRLTLQRFDNKLVVSGLVPKSTLDQLAGLGKFMPNLVVDAREDRQSARSVLFRLHFVEVNKALLESIGIQWATEAQGPAFAAQGIAVRDGIYRRVPPAREGDNLLAPNPPFVAVGSRTSGIFFGLATSIASRLRLGMNNGDTRVLASPELTAISGGKARLQVGGEVPIPLAGALGTQTVEFKPYGIIFNIEPVVEANGTITAKVSTELSQIDPSVSVAGIPGFLTRLTSTEISVRPGEMVALSGLVNSELSTAIDRVPGLGNIPVLGRLFRSDDFRNRRTDLVVLLEPEIITPGTGMAEQLKQRGVDSTEAFDEKLRQSAPPGIVPAVNPAPAMPADPALR